MNSFFFRVDANINTGYGHAGRCITLAQELKRKKAKIFFIVEPCSKFFFKKFKDIQLIILPRNKLSMSQDANFVLNCVSKKKKDSTWIIKDHYDLDYNWEATVYKNFNNLMVIDDKLNTPHICKIYLNKCAFKEKDLKRKKKIKYFLLGFKYILIKNILKKVKRDYNRCIVYFGGVDNKNYTLKVIKQLVLIKGLKVNFDIYLGKYNCSRKKIEKIIKNNKKFEIKSFNKLFINKLSKCNYYIGSMGTSLWEILYFKTIPLIIPSQNDHKYILEILRKKNVIKCL